MRKRGIIGLGLVASGRRAILPGNQYDGLYARHELIGTNPIIGGDLSTTFDTLNHMAKIVMSTLNDTKLVAPTLLGKTLEETLRNNWNHVYKHFQYQKDANGIEQIRRPSRSWVDRKTGIDCDCMSNVLSSILTNQRINHALRKTEYNIETGWQHVYVIVPKPGVRLESFDQYAQVPRDKYYVLDCVVDRFNYEVPFIKKFDKLMKIQYLNGLDLSTLNGGVTPQKAAYASNTAELLAGFGSEFDSLDGLNDSNQVQSAFLRGLKQHLINTRTILSINPNLTAGIYQPSVFMQRLNTLIESFDNKTFIKTLGELEELEDREQVNGLSGVGLGFFKKIKKAVKKVASKVGSTVKTAAKAVATTVKKIAKAVVRYNPATIAVRNGVLLAMKLNLFRMAEKLGYGYWTEEQAKQKLDLNQWKKNKEVLEKVRKIHKALGGKLDKFDKAVLTGWKKGVEKHKLPNLGAAPVKPVIKPIVVSKPANQKAATQVNSTIPLLKLVNAQLKDIKFNTILKKDSKGDVNNFLQSLRRNQGGIATKLNFAYKPVEKANEFPKDEYAKLLKVAQYVEKLVVDRGGKAQDLRDAVKAGSNIQLTKGELGEAATASTAAASGVLATIASLLKKVDWKGMLKGKGDSEIPSEADLKKVDVTEALSDDIDDEGDPSVNPAPLTSILSSFTPQAEAAKALVTAPTVSAVKNVSASAVNSVVAKMTPKQASDLSKKIQSNPAVQNTPLAKSVKFVATVVDKTPAQAKQAVANLTPAQVQQVAKQIASSPQAEALKKTPVAQEIAKAIVKVQAATGAKPQSAQKSNEPIQDAKVVSSKLLKEESKSNTLKYVAIGGGVLATLGLGYFLMRRNQAVPVPNPAPAPTPSLGCPPPKQKLSGVKRRSSHTRPKRSMAITI